MTEKLKECPFCGGEVEVGSSGGDKTHWLIWCKCGLAQAETHCGYGDTKEEIIKAWNTRKETKPFLCKCRNDEAITLKAINDDFCKCPRCGGLIVRGRKEVNLEELFNICHETMLKDSDDKSMIWFSDTSWNIAKAIKAHLESEG